MIWGIATTEHLDSQGDIVTHSAIEKALPEYRRWRNIREMHHQRVVGKARYLVLVPGRGLLVGAEITDDECWEKIVSGQYGGLSIGGIIHDKQRRFMGGRMVSVITDMTISEISVVDQPANTQARLIISPNRDETEALKMFEKWFDKSAGNDDQKKATNELLMTLLERMERYEERDKKIIEILNELRESQESQGGRLERIENRFTTKKSAEGQSGEQRKRKWASVIGLIS